MKKTVASMVLAIATVATAQTNAPVDNFTLVTNLWWNGYKTNVLQIAEQRLAANSNDLAGLVLKLEYDLAFIDIAAVTNGIIKIMALSSCAKNGNIHANSSVIQNGLAQFLYFIENEYALSEEELALERLKALIVHKRMSNELFLKWLHDDGLF